MLRIKEDHHHDHDQSYHFNMCETYSNLCLAINAEQESESHKNMQTVQIDKT